VQKHAVYSSTDQGGGKRRSALWAIRAVCTYVTARSSITRKLCRYEDSKGRPCAPPQCAANGGGPHRPDPSGCGIRLRGSQPTATPAIVPHLRRAIGSFVGGAVEKPRLSFFSGKLGGRPIPVARTPRRRGRPMGSLPGEIPALAFGNSRAGSS
jgi:hypothetical protein